MYQLNKIDEQCHSFDSFYYFKICASFNILKAVPL